tara:strand:+ start:1092 stop:1445 length:354 start_codon:yes stop_codon:yes gene_type:complete
MAADPDRIAKVTQAARIVKSEDAGVKVFVRNARTLEIPTLLQDSVAAATENQRQFNLLKVARDRFTAQIFGHNFMFSCGQTVTVKYPRFGLETGRNFIITGVTEQPAQGRTLLSLWG